MNSRNLDYMDFKQWVQGSRREESYQNIVYWWQNSVYPGFLLSQFNESKSPQTNLISESYLDYFMSI